MAGPVNVPVEERHGPGGRISHCIVVPRAATSCVATRREAMVSC